MNRTLSVLLLASLTAGAVAFAAGGEDPVHRAIRQAVSDDPATQVAGIRALRASGEAGLDALLEASEAGWIRASEGQWNHAIDQVAGQRDARWSGLFWHTDLAEAQAEAREQGKPILSLRMLGDLHDLHSCANSRFFRAALYTNPELAAQMDEDFVLHWSSERDVPQITIRFGDGRELHSTVTGNSAHYVLDASGRPLDVIPGLLSPASFSAELDAGLSLFEAIEADPDERRETLVQHHREQLDAAIARVQLAEPSLVGARSVVLAAPLVPETDEPRHIDDPVPADFAVPIAIGKGRVEQPFLTLATDSVGDRFGPEDLVITDRGTLHPRSVAFIRSQMPAGPQADEAAVDALVQQFTRTVQADSTWNRDVLHARIHNWFVSGWDPGFEALNTRLYSEIFATPASDPWLGLHDPTVYTGLPQAGIVLDRAHGN